MNLAKIDLSMLLSCQRTVESLNKTMSFVIQELFVDKAFRFYIQSGSTVKNNYSLFSRSEHEFDEARELQQVSEMEFADVSNLTESIKYFPALGNDRISAMVVTPSDISTEVERHLLCFLAIYCNVLNLIADSRVDGLTGLDNRKTFDTELERELGLNLNEYHRRHSDKVESAQTYLALVDIDHFKKVNDQFGHLIGDEVLLTLAQKLKSNFRDHDGLFRYGGEEFAVILRDLEPHLAEQVLQRFVVNVRNSRFPTVEHITVCVGYCMLTPGEASTEVISFADKALYHAKQNGRDQVANYYHLVETGVVTEPQVETDIELF